MTNSPFPRRFLSHSVKLAFLGVAFTICLAIVALLLLRKYILRMKLVHGKKANVQRVGVFHPYCNAGGGGERVLWCAIRSLQQMYAGKIHITIYTGDVAVQADRMLLNAKNVFNIAVDGRTIDFVFLQKRGWVEPDRYPRFTLLGQSLGSMVLGLEALLKYQPDIFIDTMGYAFTYPIFRYLGACKVGSYTHYPIVSTDMLRRVKSRVYAHNNQSYVVKNPFLTWLKLTYYRLFAKVGGSIGVHIFGPTFMAFSDSTDWKFILYRSQLSHLSYTAALAGQPSP